MRKPFPSVCLEALLHAKPLVATRVGGIPEYIRHDDNGLLVPARDPDALAAAIETLVRQPELARRLAEKGANEVRQRFSAERFTAAMRQVLEEVTSRGRRCATPAALLEPLQALARERRELEMKLNAPPPAPEEIPGETQKEGSDSLPRPATTDDGSRWLGSAPLRRLLGAYLHLIRRPSKGNPPP